MTCDALVNKALWNSFHTKGKVKDFGRRKYHSNEMIFESLKDVSVPVKCAMHQKDSGVRCLRYTPCTTPESVKCVCPVAQSAAVELVVSDDRSLIVHSHRRILAREFVGCVVVDSETGAEYTESRV